MITTNIDIKYVKRMRIIIIFGAIFISIFASFLGSKGIRGIYTMKKLSGSNQLVENGTIIQIGKGQRDWNNTVKFVLDNEKPQKEYHIHLFTSFHKVQIGEKIKVLFDEKRKNYIILGLEKAINAANILFVFLSLFLFSYCIFLIANYKDPFRTKPKKIKIKNNLMDT